MKAILMQVAAQLAAGVVANLPDDLPLDAEVKDNKLRATNLLTWELFRIFYHAAVAAHDSDQWPAPAQLMAGLQEMKTGNNFGYCAFTSYGALWIALCLMLLAGNYGLFKASHTDVGWFLVAWTLFTAILWVGSLRIHGAMATTFTLLLAGFVLLDLGHFGFPVCNTIAAYVLIGCALMAWYMMARIILNELYGRELLPAGKAWVAAPTAAKSHGGRPADEGGGGAGAKTPAACP